MSGTMWDAPNQQVVRPDESAPWDEGEGGTMHPAPKEEAGGYAGMTKAELLEAAVARGISPANNDMTKADLLAALEEAD